MQTVQVHIKVDCPNEKQWLEVSTLLKTLAHTLDIAMETNNSGNDFKYEVDNAHPESKTEYVGTRGDKPHPLRKAFGV